jgi:hypothetical protein
MDENIVQELLHELFSSLESLDTQTTAALQLLKDKGIADEQELASHLERAGNASSVRWRAVRVRVDYLLTGAIKTAEREAKKEAPKPSEGLPQEAKPSAEQSDEKNPEPWSQEVGVQGGANQRPKPRQASTEDKAGRDNDRNQPVKQAADADQGENRSGKNTANDAA